MKKLLIIYNVIFLLIGNQLFSHIHHETHNDFDKHEIEECQECLIIESSSNFITNFSEVFFSNNNTNFFLPKYFCVIGFNFIRTYSSRAPPIF